MARKSKGDEFSFEPMSKRRRGFPSETNVKRGPRSVRGGETELLERLGNNDLCPCGSGRRFQTLLPQQRPLSTAPVATTTSGSAERDRAPGREAAPFASVAQWKSTGLRTRAQRFDSSRGLFLPSWSLRAFRVGGADGQPAGAGLA